jgi:hypothetical protein
MWLKVTLANEGLLASPHPARFPNHHNLAETIIARLGFLSGGPLFGLLVKWH